MWFLLLVIDGVFIPNNQYIAGFKNPLCTICSWWYFLLVLTSHKLMLSTSRWWCTTSITDIYEAGFFKLINEAFDTLAYGGHPFNITHMYLELWKVMLYILYLLLRFILCSFFWGGMKSLAALLHFWLSSLVSSNWLSYNVHKTHRRGSEISISEFFFKKKGFVVKHSVSVNEEEGVAAQNIEDCWWRVFCSLKRREEGDKVINNLKNKQDQLRSIKFINSSSKIQTMLIGKRSWTWSSRYFAKFSYPLWAKSLNVC